MADGSVVVIGGTSGLGLDVARRYVDKGFSVVIAGRDLDRCSDIGRGIGADSVALDLSEPATIARGLATVGPVRALVLASIERDSNSVADYDIGRATRLVTLKLIGYTEVVHQLKDRFLPEASVVLFGGLAKERPYPGSTTVSTRSTAASWA